MINVLEATNPQTYSVAARHKEVAKDAPPLVSTPRVRDGAPDASYRPPLSSPSDLGRLKTAILKQSLAADRPVSEPRLPSPQQSGDSAGANGATWTPEANEGFEYPKLDASWKIIPTESLADDATFHAVERLV